MSASPEAARTRRVAGLLGERGVDLLLVEHPVNLRYLTGFTGSNGLALIADGSQLFYTDFRYDTQSAEQVPGSFDRRIVAIDLLEAAARELAELPLEAAAPSGESTGGPAGGRPVAPSGLRPVAPAGGRLGFDEANLTVSRHLRLGELLGERWELVPCAGLVEELREIKEPPELARIAAAAELADEALRGVLEGGLVGHTERDVALELELRMRRLGAESPSFPSIVAAGPHSALPHAEPRDVKIPRDTLLTIDWGALHDGYCSDCTRTFATGALDDEARAVYELVLRAQRQGLAAVRPGPTGREVDRIAREVIEQAGRGERFGHGLGHGVGLEVHEAPRLSRTAGEQALRAGDVVTVEPGVYLPGRFGVRIEDLVVVTPDGHRVLSGLPKELVVVQ
jgi:Xaa-Pro aminopeptidase